MEKIDRFETFQQNTFEYMGKSYHIAYEGGIVIAIEKEQLPKILSRVLPDTELVFDENGILSTKSDNNQNDMVSLSSVDEWEKFARMFYLDKQFKVISVDTASLVGPTFLAGNRILHNGEILALVPKRSILTENRYTWTKAEPDYDYKQTEYADDYDRDFYQRLVVNRSMGFKPVEIK